jgi:hypothetical protein
MQWQDVYRSLPAHDLEVLKNWRDKVNRAKMHGAVAHPITDAVLQEKPTKVALARNSPASKLLKAASPPRETRRTRLNFSEAREVIKDNFPSSDSHPSDDDDDDIPLRVLDLGGSARETEKPTSREVKQRAKERESIFFFDAPSLSASSLHPFQNNPSPIMPKKTRPRTAQRPIQKPAAKKKPIAAATGEFFASPLRGRKPTKASAFANPTKAVVKDDDALEVVQSPDRPTLASRLKTEAIAHKLASPVRTYILDDTEDQPPQRPKTSRRAADPSTSPRREPRPFLPVRGNQSPLLFQAKLAERLRKEQARSSAHP